VLERVTFGKGPCKNQELLPKRPAGVSQPRLPSSCRCVYMCVCMREGGARGQGMKRESVCKRETYTVLHTCMREQKCVCVE